MATIAAASAAQADVVTAIAAASTGDTVTVPAGEETWTSYVSISGKNITVQGAGMTQTIISNYSFDWNDTSSRITGFRFNETSIGGSNGSEGYGWRIDHCYFYSTTLRSINIKGQVLLGACPTGLIDNCTMYNVRPVVYGYPESNKTEQEAPANYAHYQWATPLALGTNNAVFIEDCVMTYDVLANCVDSGPGGRYVFRYNTVTDAYVEAHSSQDGRRGSRSFEIYGNTIAQSAKSIYMPFRLRGGTGVVYNNTITGTFGIKRIGLDNVRSFSDTHYPGLADGNKDWDGNLGVGAAAGWPARDQLGCAVDDWQWTDNENIPTQTLDPAYFWDNVDELDAAVTPLVINSCDHHIVADQDYVVGTEKSGYIPYTYPHPLRRLHMGPVSMLFT